MPKPPTLPKIDWNELFNSATPYQQWIEKAESKANADRIEELRNALELPTPHITRIGGLSRKVHVFAIAEDWCGDVIAHAPILQKLSDLNPLLSIAYSSREQCPEVFIRFLTNGGEAIPKFVFLSEFFVECGNWGPMPEACKELIARGKARGDVASARMKVAELYAEAAHIERVAEELLQLIDIASA